MNSILVSSGRWQDAIAAAHLARSTGKSGPLLLTHGEHLPAAVESYFWRLRPPYANTPEEGPYSNVWVVGSFARIPYMAQTRADYAEEIEQYMTLGDSALSGFEELALAWLVFAIASAIWIAYNAGRRAPDIMPMMRAAWVASDRFVLARIPGWSPDHGSDNDRGIDWYDADDAVGTDVIPSQHADADW